MTHCGASNVQDSSRFRTTMSKALHGDGAKYIAGLLVNCISAPPVELTRLGVKIFLDSVNHPILS